MVRGVVHVVNLNSLNAGIGHLILGILLVMILISIKSANKNMAY